MILCVASLGLSNCGYLSSPADSPEFLKHSELSNISLYFISTNKLSSNSNILEREDTLMLLQLRDFHVFIHFVDYHLIGMVNHSTDCILTSEPLLHYRRHKIPVVGEAHN